MRSSYFFNLINVVFMICDIYTDHYFWCLIHAGSFITLSILIRFKPILDVRLAVLGQGKILGQPVFNSGLNYQSLIWNRYNTHRVLMLKHNYSCPSVAYSRRIYDPTNNFGNMPYFPYYFSLHTYQVL